MAPAARGKSSIRDIVNMYMSSFIGLGLYRFVFLPAGTSRPLVMENNLLGLIPHLHHADKAPEPTEWQKKKKVVWELINLLFLLHFHPYILSHQICSNDQDIKRSFVGKSV